LVEQTLLAGDFIEVLRNKARVIQAGARVLSGLVGNVTLPRQSTQGSTYWVTEGSNLTESEATFYSVMLQPRTIGTVSQITRQMLLQSTPDIEMLVRADFIATMALGIDLAALSGATGGANPVGISNAAGVNTIVGGTNGAAITIDMLIAMEAACADANAPEETLAYITNAKTIGSLKSLRSTTGQYLWTNSPIGMRSGTPGEINGYPVFRSNQARKNLTKGTSTSCSELFYGAWSELIIGEWGVLEVLPNPYGSGFAAGTIQLRVLQTLDICLRHGQSFAYINDAIVMA
jgi:HK97 family phage major capsid protein